MSIRYMKTLLSIMRQRYMTENLLKMEVVVWFCVLLGIFLNTFSHRKKSMKLLMQAHRSTRSTWLKRWLCTRYIKHNLNLCGYDCALNNTEFAKVQGWLKDRMIVLKKKQSAQEKGVLLIKFTPVLEVLPRALDMKALLREYTLVVEPSWSGICQPEILQFCAYHEDIHVMAPEESDYEFILMLESNLKPMTLGPGDWVAAGDVCSTSSVKKFDIVMNSNWGSWKRHYVLFRALKKMPDSTRVALIGFPLWGEGRDKIERLVKYYKIEKQVVIFENIAHSEVMKVVSESNVGALMSLKEGANKSVSECILSGVPVVLLDSHVGGARGKINSLTGRFSSERDLAFQLQELIVTVNKESTKKWGLENISSRAATNKLNTILRLSAIESNQTWTEDIVEKRNSPELDYAIDSDRAYFVDVNLEQFV